MKYSVYLSTVLFMTFSLSAECEKLNNWSLFSNIFVDSASAGNSATNGKEASKPQDLVVILDDPDYESVLDEDEEVLAEDALVLRLTLDTMDNMDQLLGNLMKTMAGMSDEGQLLIGSALPRVGLPTSGHNNTQCRVDSLTVRDAAANLSTWALQMLDATANPSDSYISLSDVYNLGNFDECLAVRVDDPSPDSFVGQQCLVSIQGADDASYATSQDHAETIVDLLKNRSLYWAMCIPSSCTAQDLLHHVQTLLSGPRVSVLERDCYTNTEARHWDVAELIFFALLGVIIVLIILSSFYDFVTSKYKHTIQEVPVLTAFSLRKNLKALFSRKATSASLKSLHGIKLMSVIWVLMARRYKTDSQLPTLNHDRMVSETLQHGSGGSFLGWNQAVDTFLLISGVLLAHGFFRDRQSKRSFNVPVYYIYRYVRLTPVYGLVIGLYATLFHRFGSGPFWNATVGTSKEFCRENWWLNLLYVNNYVYPDRQCVEDSWFLSVMVQLFWIAPVILYPLWKWPVFGKIILFTTFLVSIIVPVSLVIPWTGFGNTVDFGEFLGDWDVSFMLNAEQEDDLRVLPGSDIINTFDLPLYQATFIRSSPYFIGIGLGYLLHNIHKDKDTSFSMSRWTVASGWLLSILINVIVIYVVSGVHLENDVYLTTLPGVGSSLSTAWVIFACESGYAGGLTKLLSWKLFKPLSRLSFSAFLVHGLVLQYDSGSIKTLQYFSYYGEVHKVLGDLLMVFSLSAILYLAFEKPIINLNRALFKPELLHRNLQVTEECLQYLSNSNYCFEKSGKNGEKENPYGTAPGRDGAKENTYGTAPTAGVPTITR